jgi:hypothetical protein
MQNGDNEKKGERSKNITLVIGCHASSSVILPPLIICKGVRMDKDLTKEVPVDANFSTSPKGFINSEIFYNWFI